MSQNKVLILTTVDLPKDLIESRNILVLPQIIHLEIMS